MSALLAKLKAVFQQDGLKSEIVQTLKLAFPVMAMYLVGTLLGVVNVIYVGHIGAVELAAASLGNMFVNVTGFSLAVGLCAAIDTLGSQAYGAGNYKRVGLIAQRGLVVVWGLAIPIAILWLFFSEMILLASGQEPEVARLASLYVKLCVPCLVQYFSYEVLRRYMQVQGIMVPLMVISFIGTGVNALCSYLLIFVLNLGFIGAPISLCITHTTMLSCLLTYFAIKKIHIPTWPKWSREVFDRPAWAEYFKLALPGLLTVCVEWWCFELMSLLAGWFGVISLAAQSLLMTTFSLTYQVPQGIAIAASTRVGNLLGAGQPENAKFAAKISMFLGVFLSSIVAITMFGVRNQWGYIFSSDDQVVQLAGFVLNIAFVYMILDGGQATSVGILRGCGKQRMSAICVVVAYYLVGLPLGVSLSFAVNWGIFGLWIGMLGAVSTLCLAYIIIIFRTNWAEQSELAVKAQVAKILQPDQQEPLLEPTLDMDMDGKDIEMSHLIHRRPSKLVHVEQDSLSQDVDLDDSQRRVSIVIAPRSPSNEYSTLRRLSMAVVGGHVPPPSPTID